MEKLACAGPPCIMRVYPAVPEAPVSIVQSYIQIVAMNTCKSRGRRAAFPAPDRKIKKCLVRAGAPSEDRLRWRICRRLWQTQAMKQLAMQATTPLALAAMPQVRPLTVAACSQPSHAQYVPDPYVVIQRQMADCKVSLCLGPFTSAMMAFRRHLICMVGQEQMR